MPSRHQPCRSGSGCARALISSSSGERSGQTGEGCMSALPPADGTALVVSRPFGSLPHALSSTGDGDCRSLVTVAFDDWDPNSQIRWWNDHGGRPICSPSSKLAVLPGYGRQPFAARSTSACSDPKKGTYRRSGCHSRGHAGCRCPR